MFGMGWAEIAVIVIVALILFGPDRLPAMARQAGQFVRTMRQMANSAKADLGRELGQDFTDVQLRDLDPREVVKRNLLASPIGSDSNSPRSSTEPAAKLLRPGQIPPYDPEAT